MPRLNITARGSFATPVVAVEVPASGDRIGPGVERRRLALGPRRRATRGSRVAELPDLARQVADQPTAGRQGQRIGPKWLVEASTNVDEPGDGNIGHYHPGGFWLGTSYMDDGGCADDPACGDGFKMLDPRDRGPDTHAPALKFAGEDGASVGAGETTQPKRGLLFVFPSWLFHQVRPYRGNRLCISIAFNPGLAARNGE